MRFARRLYAAWLLGTYAGALLSTVALIGALGVPMVTSDDHSDEADDGTEAPADR